MKKWIAILLIFGLLFGLCGCHPSTPGVPTEYGKEPTADENDIPGRPKEDYDGDVLDDSHCAAPTYMQQIPYLAKYVGTDGGKEGMEFPAVVLIHSVEELEQYIEENRAYFDLESRDSLTADSEPGFMDYCTFYDEAFFEKQYLVMILVEEGSDAMYHEVSHVGISGDGILYVNLQTVIPEEEWDYVAQQWHILIELEKEYDVEYAENVRLGGRNYGEKHTLTVETGDVPIYTELLQKTYSAGEIVRVRTDVLPDEMIDLYLNGKRLDSPIEVGVAPEGSTEDITCWEYAFVMPDEDAVLTAAVRDRAPEEYYLTYYCPELGEESPYFWLNQRTGEFMATRYAFTSALYLHGTFTWEDDRLILTEAMESDNTFCMVFELDGKDLIFRAEESWNYPEPFVDGMPWRLWEGNDADIPIGSVYHEPPEMKLVVGGNSTPGVLGEYIWTVYQGDVASTSQTDFDMLMLMVAGAVPKFEVFDGIGMLCFASEDPDDISVRRWTADNWGDLQAYTDVPVLGDSIQLEMGMHLYEVKATWDRENYQGTACYYFLVECWVDVPEQPDPDIGSETGFKMLRYNWDGYGIGQKEIDSCDLGYAIIDCLSKLQETGDVIPKISEDEVNEFTGELPVKSGTVWIDCGSIGLFRLNPEMTEICKVNTHLGEGKVMQMTDTLRELIVQAWYYYPYDYWSGTYENGTVTLRQVCKNDSVVEWVEIESIHIENKIDSRNNKITLRIRANDSKTVKARLESYQSDDNLGSEDVQEIELVNGSETVAEFTFYGFYNYSYMVSITIDNTRIVLTINPKDAN